MYTTCPKCGYVRAPDDATTPDRCPACGVIFEKWLKHSLRAELNTKRTHRSTKLDNTSTAQIPNIIPILRNFFLPSPEIGTNPFVFYGRVSVYLVILIWGWQFIFMPYYYTIGGLRIDTPVPAIGDSIMHLVNLPFHEAGHVLFRPFGNFMMVLGGSLMQIIVPLVVMFTFLIKQRDAFAAAIGLWWTGQSLMDLAPYINDARNGQMLLIGGRFGKDDPDFHDWHNLLERMGILHWDHGLADFIDFTGGLVMIIAFIWGGYALYQQFTKL